MKIVILPMLAALVPAAALAQTAPSSSAAGPSAPTQTAGGQAAGGMTLDQFRERGMARMMAADTDGDGRISKAEAQAIGPAGGARMFDMADANHDGYLDKAELQAALDHRFQRMDTNGDGIVTPEERQARRGPGDGSHRHRDDAMPSGQPSAPATPQ